MSVSARGAQPVGVGLTAVAVVAVVVGVALRFVAPTPLWLDEALSVNIAVLGPSELTDALRQDGHPPLYYLVLWAWTSVLGTGDVAVRSLSGLLSVAALWPAWVLARRRGGTVLGVAAVAVLAMSPYAIRYASETRMYSLLMLLVLVGAVLVDDLARGEGGWRLWALGIVSAALVLTHYWGGVVVGVTILACAVTGWLHPTQRSGRWRAAGAAAVGSLAFVVWVPTFLHQSATTGTPWAPAVRPGAAVGASLRDLAGGRIDEAVAGAAILGVLLVVGITGRPDGRWGIHLDLRTVPGVRPEVLVAAATLIAGATLAFLSGATFATRYAAVVAPLVLLGVAAGCCVPAVPAVRAGLVALVCTLGLVGAADQLGTQRTQAGEVADALAATAGPGDVVVACPDQLGPALSRTLPDDVTLLAYPTLGPAERVDWQDYAERNAAVEPTVVADEVLERAGDAGVAVAWWPTYETYEGQCEALLAALEDARPGQILVQGDAAGAFEPMNLTWFPAPGGEPGSGAG